MSKAHGSRIAGKAGYTLGCILASIVLVGSGFAYYVRAQADGIGGSNVLSGGPSTGAMNILLMGLESRTYWNGQPLPRGLEDVMHIGSVGGNATNTLILIHIFAGGQKAVGFSIPRDDWVDMVGTNGYGGAQGKIDQAYGFAMADKMSQLAQQDPGTSSQQRDFEGNEAGRLAAVQTVEALTGVHIDRFAELNLDGFYELANVFGGIEACVNSWNGGENLHDANSGANLKVGYQHLDAAQTLAFVRERDNLPNGDLDRTHRQQAVLDYVIWKLEHEGVFSDLSQMSALLTVAKQYLITSAGWNLLQFAGEMKALTGNNLTFETLPIVGYQTIDGQDANVVNLAYIKQVVHDTFYPPATSGSAMKSAGKSAATSLAAGIAAAKTTSLTSSSPTSSASSSAPTASQSNGASGGAVTVQPNAPYGIPCVY
jgi:LCP family protein required for cell wall assembly